MLEWKDAKGYDDYFKVSTDGQVYSKRTNKLLKLHTNKNGYIIFSTRLGGRKSKAICLKVHQLVANTYIEKPCDSMVVNHKDGVKANNNVGNLEWVTYSQNTLHAIEIGTLVPRRGVESSISLLSEEDVRNIRKLYIPKYFGPRKIAKKLNLPLGAVQGVIYKGTWLHVE